MNHMNKEPAISNVRGFGQFSALQSQEYPLFWSYVFRTTSNSIRDAQKTFLSWSHIRPNARGEPSIGDKRLEDNMRVNIGDLFRNSSVAVLNLTNAFPRSWNDPNPLEAQTVPDPQAGRIVGVNEVEDTRSESQSTCVPLECATQQRPQPQAATRKWDDKPGVADLDLPITGLAYRPRGMPHNAHAKNALDNWA